MKINYVFIDYENVQVQSLDLLNSEYFKVFLFLGANNTKLPISLFISVHAMAERVKLITLDRSGKNALDFYITYYLGTEVAKDSTGIFHIISKDSGFDPLIQHLKTKKILSARSPSIEEMPCFKPAVERVVDAIKEQHPISLLPEIKINEQKINNNSTLQEKSLTLQIIEFINNKKTSKPATRKSMLNTLQAKFGKEISLQNIENILNRLIKSEFIKMNGEKIIYIHSEI